MAESNHNTQSTDNPQLLIFHIIEERLRDSVKREEEIDFKSARDNRHTQTIGRVSVLIVLILTPPVFYLIWSLVLSMGMITERMHTMRDDVSGMRNNFDAVTMQVDLIEASVANMSTNIAVIPPMERRVAGMRNDYDQITAAMNGIAPNVSRIDGVLSVMDANMGHMNYMFGFLNRDVFVMRRNVNQMSSPMRMIPFFGQ